MTGRTERLRRTTLAAVIAPVAVIAATLGMQLLGAGPASAATVDFHPLVPPARAIDTRDSDAPLGPSEARAVTVAGIGGVPADATAVALNVTVTDATGSSYVTVWPSGSPQPTASNLNFITGQTIANMVTVGIGPDGAVQVFNHAGFVHVVVDIDGWYSGGFHPIAPARLLDTRNSLTALAASEARDLVVAGAHGVPADATAVAVNVTVTEPTASGYLTVYPAGATRPTASNINFVPGQTVPNMVTVGLGTNGAVTLFNSNGDTHVVVDLAGWYSGGFHAASPVRIMDSRQGQCGVRLAAGETRLVSVAGQGAVPATAGAVALNVTVTNPTSPTFVTLYPTGQDRPATSNVNAIVGTVPNMVTVGLGPDGRVALYNQKGTVDVVIDVAGWFDGAGPLAPVATCDSLPGTAPAAVLANELATPPSAPVTAATFNSPGYVVAALQARLLELGYWVPDTDGSYGQVTSQAVMAFQKAHGIRPASGVADPMTAFMIGMENLKPTGQSRTGDLVEVDKARQLLHIVRGGKTVLTVNTSTGSDVPYTEVDQTHGGTTNGDAHTPTGRFNVYRVFSDGWEKGQLGELYRPRYIHGGVAVHGAPNIPNYPASHGCIRVSTTFMDYVWAVDLIPFGSQVWVHD